ncbi:ribose-phosphate diphosphokinase [Methylocaldum sp. RMAD-M]|jgi:ribose-phosphate pyrophosphokinase|uniref:ribose-phosphate diphosphokinase n=1 Tax=unclassified Methylocaldum TaxID=2622260 RepID=UPI001AE7EFBC|nr:ribose-phosphate diphosphokinase [Methylocaldum sp. RMAD-M]MBP1151912.1 ribose-phosphate pyrophosphokinase [Methylocaldum sp. RMAD-M]
MILGFSDSRVQAMAVVEALDARYGEVGIHRFPDGESKVTLPEIKDEHVVVFRSLQDPNDKLVELLLVARALRNQGVNRLSLIAPYLCYMRQDCAFQPGEIVSQKIIGEFLAGLFDDVVTVDPHLHRISRLEEAVPARNPIVVPAAPLFARYLANRSDKPLLVGPDAESEQWVSAIAKGCGLPFVVAFKQRFGDRAVSVETTDFQVRGRSVVLVDDVASTGTTLTEAVAKLRALGAEKVDVLVTHPLFVENAVDKLRRSGVSEIGSSDSILHSTNVVFLAPILAETLRNALDYNRNSS